MHTLPIVGVFRVVANDRERFLSDRAPALLLDGRVQRGFSSVMACSHFHYERVPQFGFRCRDSPQHDHSPPNRGDRRLNSKVGVQSERSRRSHGSGSLASPRFFSELVAGRSIPLFILLGLTALRLMIVQDATPKMLRLGALGAVLAAMFMTRFDGALWVIVLFPFVLALGPRPHGVFAFCAVYAAIISPWITYSMTHFDVALVSNNSWVARSLDPNAFITDFPPALGLTISDDPAFAIETVIGRIPDLLRAAAASPGRPGLLVFIIFLVLLFVAAPWRRFSFAVLASGRALPFIAAGLAIASSSPSYLLTGYFDGRYFSFPFAFSVFFVLAGIWTGVRAKKLLRVSALVVSIAAVAIVLFLVPGRTSSPQIDLPHESELAACLGLEPNHPPILVTKATQGARLTALYGVRTAFFPANFLRGASDPAVHEAFLNAYGIEYALDPRGSVANVFIAQRLFFFSSCGLDVFRILRLETPTHER